MANTGPLNGLPSGAVFASGFRELPPCWMPGHLAHDTASAYGAIGAVAAVLARTRGELGQLVEVSVQEAALASTTPWSIPLKDYEKLVPGIPTAGRRNADGVYWVLPAKDGWVRTIIGSPRRWDGFVELLGNPELLAEPEWQDNTYRLRQHDVIRLVAGDTLADRTRQELFDQVLGTGATIGMLLTPSEFVAHPQTRARRAFEPLDIPGAPGAPAVRTPFRLSATAPPPRTDAPSGAGGALPEWPARRPLPGPLGAGHPRHAEHAGPLGAVHPCAQVAPRRAPGRRVRRGGGGPRSSRRPFRARGRRDQDRIAGPSGRVATGRDRWEVARLLQDHQISAMPVLGPDDHHRDAHLAARSAILTLHHPEVGDERQVANPLRLSTTAQRRAESAPCLGADTLEVLTSVLGLGAPEVDDLVARGVCR